MKRRISSIPLFSSHALHIKDFRTNSSLICRAISFIPTLIRMAVLFWDIVQFQQPYFIMIGDFKNPIPDFSLNVIIHDIGRRNTWNGLGIFQLRGYLRIPLSSLFLRPTEILTTSPLERPVDQDTLSLVSDDCPCTRRALINDRFFLTRIYSSSVSKSCSSISTGEISMIPEPSCP